MTEAKITIVSPRSPIKFYGGVEHHVLEISKRLSERGFNINILATDTYSKLPEVHVLDDLTIKTYPAFSPQNSYDFSPMLFKAIKQDKSDIIHVHGFYAFHMPMAALAKRRDQKFILTIHSSASSSFLRRLFRIPYLYLCRNILSNVDKIICVSKEEYYRYRKYLALPKDVYTIIPNGVNLEEFINPCIETEIKDPFILSVGRIEECKGFHFLIKSLKDIQNIYPNLKLIIVGSGPYKQKLLHLIEKYDLVNKVEFYESIPREKLVSLYSSCALFALLSRGESSGIAVLEALVAKRPVIVTNTYALKNYVEKGFAVGVSYPPAINEINKKIISILNNPNDYVPTYFQIPTWDFVVDQLSNLYNCMLNDY